MWYPLQWTGLQWLAWNKGGRGIQRLRSDIASKYRINPSEVMQCNVTISIACHLPVVWVKHLAWLGSSISGSLLELLIAEGFTRAIRGTSQDAKHMSGRLGMTDGEVLGLPEGGRLGPLYFKAGQEGAVRGKGQGLACFGLICQGEGPSQVCSESGVLVKRS